VLSARWDKERTRSRLMRNLFIAAVLYGGLAFPFEAALLEKSLDAGLSIPLAIGLTAGLLLLLPIYLASQTVPMLSELTNDEGKAGKAAGKVLFYSTVGSVAGGIVTPVWLFPTIGVVRSGQAVCLLLAWVAGLIAMEHGAIKRLGFGATALIAVLLLPGWRASAGQLFAFDSAYQSMQIIEEGEGRKQRILLMGGSRSSGVYADNGETSFEYVLAAEKAMAEVKPATVLVVGAAGFTFPRDIARLDFVHQIDAVDVDPAVKTVAEQQFLKAPLPAKVRFLPLSARYAVRKLRHDIGRYDFTFVDAYFGKGIPDELLTVEFFDDVRKISAHTAINVVMDGEMESTFARNLLASFQQVYGAAWSKPVKSGDTELTNIMVTDWPAEGATRWSGLGAPYRDDRNSADRDHVKLVWSGE
jgi:spermidine synthase